MSKEDIVRAKAFLELLVNSRDDRIVDPLDTLAKCEEGLEIIGRCFKEIVQRLHDAHTCDVCSKVCESKMRFVEHSIECFRGVEIRVCERCDMCLKKEEFEEHQKRCTDD